MKPVIRIRGRAFDFEVPLGNGPARVAGGGASYGEGRRPKSDAVTLFEGNALLRLEVPVLLDNWRTKRDVWPKVAQIYNLCVGPPNGDPPDFVATGPIPFSGTRFQMELPEEGVANRDADGTLIRQELLLRLIEFNDPSEIAWRLTPKRGISGNVNLGQRFAEGKVGSFVLDRPMSLQEVAAQVYGDAGLAGQIAKANDMRDVRKKLAKGKRIKLLANPSGEPGLDAGSGA